MTLAGSRLQAWCSHHRKCVHYLYYSLFLLCLLHLHASYKSRQLQVVQSVKKLLAHQNQGPLLQEEGSKNYKISKHPPLCHTAITIGPSSLEVHAIFKVSLQMLFSSSTVPVPSNCYRTTSFFFLLCDTMSFVLCLVDVAAPCA